MKLGLEYFFFNSLKGKWKKSWLYTSIVPIIDDPEIQIQVTQLFWLFESKRGRVE